LLKKFKDNYKNRNMAKQSAGILAYRIKNGQLQVFLVHPGGPFWQHKDINTWSIPKGEIEQGEDKWHAAIREFKEETGITLSVKNPIELKPVKQKGGKEVFAWAIETNFDADKIKSNSFEMEWPPKSGHFKKFPEIDKGQWFDIATAMIKINKAQQDFLEELKEKLGF